MRRGAKLGGAVGAGGDDVELLELVDEVLGIAVRHLVLHQGEEGGPVLRTGPGFGEAGVGEAVCQIEGAAEALEAVGIEPDADPGTAAEELAGGNVLRALRRAEAVSASMKDVPPALDKLPAAP